VILTANAILRGEGERPTFSVYFGYDYVTNGERSIKMGESHVLLNPSGAADLPNSFTVEDFQNVFHTTFSDTSVNVDSLVNLVYIFRKSFRDYDLEKTTEGRLHRILY
jgi:hypothetical protein